MRRRIFRCSAVLLMVLLFTGGGRAGVARVNAETGTCGEAGAAACADADARATDSSARRKATPDEAKRDETEDEEWDEWADMVLFDEEATPSSALLADTGCGLWRSCAGCWSRELRTSVCPGTLSWSRDKVLRSGRRRPGRWI